MSERKCGCVYADERNTPAVRAGHEMGGYLQKPCAEHADNRDWSTATPPEERPKTIVRLNAESDPNYRPYCNPCPGLTRMDRVSPFFWRCRRCGAEHDERRPEDATTPTGGEDEIASLRARLTFCDGCGTPRGEHLEHCGEPAYDRSGPDEPPCVDRCGEWVTSADLVRDRDAALARAEAAERERDEAKALPRYQEYLAALARAEAAEALAYIGDLRFPDLTWKTRCEELVPDLRAAQARAEAAEARIATARQEGWQAGAEMMREACADACRPEHPDAVRRINALPLPDDGGEG